MKKHLIRRHLMFTEAPGETGGGTAPPPSPTPAPAGASTEKTWTPITSQEEFDERVKERLARERAKFADYPQLKEKASKADELLEAQKTDHEKAIDAARKEGGQQAVEKVNTRLVTAEARALAAGGKWRISPAAVVKQLDLSGVKVGEDGEVDAAAIRTALDDLAKNEPGLVADDTPKPPPSFGGGPRTTSAPAKPASLTDAVLARMTKP